MTRTIHCAKLDKDAAGLAQPPIPGELGQRIYEHISAEAWSGWVQHQTMLINEYRLSLIEPSARTFLMRELEKYLFGDGSEKPPGFQDLDA
jgi:Fe-S cluster biosynthesis and repair protein YggX